MSSSASNCAEASVMLRRQTRKSFQKKMALVFVAKPSVPKSKKVSTCLVMNRFCC